ncbi:hypothetical protein LMG19083_04858 [Ralstonia psammae]|uniref:Tetratricopeptide repeat protein n=1 Tax=Ralstonia psammae TaxID=3058598 RepID=A0ABM9K089_9RALS|nr:tetratricopeptide repeat-containing glycosyltransferase family protein [Ralstonia sp. LMG 19083]CAJ0809144.1 hypothetical protein LMG19083_04858 [Ralstonia sp. LMG 19083]
MPIVMTDERAQHWLTFLRSAAATPQALRAPQLRAAHILYPLDPPSVIDVIDLWLGAERVAPADELAELMVTLYPEQAGAWFCRGYVLQRQHQHAQALAMYERARMLDANYPSLRNNMAAALRFGAGDIERALALWEEAVHVDPCDAKAWINLAGAYRECGELARALEAGAQAVMLAPDDPLALNNAALALKEAGRWEQALALSLRAARFGPQDPAIQFNLALMHLVLGDYDQGLPLYEARWEGSTELAGHRPALLAPPWHGEPLQGKTLLLWGEQGMGDILQFCRYVPLLAQVVHAQGGRLVWNTAPTAMRLFARAFGAHVDALVTGGQESLPRYDYEIGLLSLPLWAETRPDTIPSPGPYLHADPAAVPAWRARFAAEPRLKVGLVWTGSAGHARNPFRSVPLEALAAKLAPLQTDVAFYSLQMGAGDELAPLAAEGFAIADLTTGWTDFEDTAACLEALDVVITVCTSVAHLAGALGRPTWVLLDQNPHWVWGLAREDCPWYASARLFRQPAFGRWDSVLDAVAAALTERVAQPPAPGEATPTASPPGEADPQNGVSV